MNDNNNNKGSFLLTLLFSLISNILWSIPAWILLVLHFVIDISIVWFICAISLWVILLIVSAWMIKFANKCSNIPDPPKENKNPYSNKSN